MTNLAQDISGPSYDPADGIAWVNGKYVPIAEASIPILDRGFLRSDVTYDVVHVFEGSFYRLDDHINRFFRSMEMLHMRIEQSKVEVAEILTECVRRTGLKDAFVSMNCTRGVSPKGTRDPRLCTNKLYVYVHGFVWIADEEQRKAGLKMTVSSIQRIPPESVDPRIKNYHWLDMTMGLFEAYERGADTVVLHDGKGNVTEGPGFNIFSIKGGRIATPERGMLEGITRRSVIELARENGIVCEERPVSIKELMASDEVFVSSTAGGIMPVTKIDAQFVGNGHPGVVTERVNAIYWQSHKLPRYATPIAY
jgi:branched-chain amino acid aminotransferase